MSYSTIITIHESGHGADKLEVVSYGNGSAYAVHFGEAGTPMRTLWFQGDDATELREEFDTLESHEPETDTRELWMRVIDPYL